MRNMNTAFHLAKKNLEENRKNMKLQHDKRAKELNYQIGDKVLLDVRITGPDKNFKKPTPKFEGPYRILEVNSNSTVKIINSNFNTQLAHINRIKPLFET